MIDMTTDKKRSIQFYGIVLLISLIGLCLRIFNLQLQPLTIDDVSVVVSAVNYMETGHLGPTMWNHPNLRNIFVYLFMELFGKGVWGIKGASLIFGTLSVPVLALLTNRIFRCREIAYIAALFLALDALHIDFSRQAVHEVYMMFFALSGIYFSLMFMDGRHPVWLIFSAVLFGLGVASKWYVLFPLLVTLIYLIYNAANTSENGKYFRLSFITTTLILVPLTVYLATFLPWVIHGHDIYELFALQKYMYSETVTHGGYSPYDMQLDHKAYLWFIKPVAYVDVAVKNAVPSIFAGIANPLVWLLTIPSMIYLYSKGERERNRGYFFVLGLFIFTYIPVLFTGRPIWAHTAFSVLPFAFMAIAFFIWNSLKKKRYGTAYIVLYLLFVLLFSAPLYVMATGKGMDYAVLKPIVTLFKPKVI